MISLVENSVLKDYFKHGTVLECLDWIWM